MIRPNHSSGTAAVLSPVPDEAAGALAASQSSGSFYITGGPVPLSSASYVIRRADEDLFNFLSAGDFCYVLNTRQMGKSSLMVRAAWRLRQELGATVAILDLTAVGQNLNPEQWYDGLLMLLGEQTRLEDELEDFWQDHERLGPLQRFLAALRQVVLPRVAGQLVIFVDEIDAIRSLPFPTDEFFAGIRECYNHRATDPEYARLVFCLVGVATPADLVSDPRVTPFNIGRRIVLTDFAEWEADPLSWGFGIALGGDKILRRVLHWTNGHPYLTQRLCRAISEQDARPTPALVDQVCRSLFLSKPGQDSDDNLAFVRNRLLRDPHYRAEDILELYAQIRSGRPVPDDEADPHAAVLRLSGVAKPDERGCLVVRNRIYAHVFDLFWAQSSLSEAEIRRQRVAARQARVQVGGAAAIVVGVLIALNVFLFRQIDASRRIQQKLNHVNQKLIRQQKASETQLRDLQRANGEIARQKEQMRRLLQQFGYDSLRSKLPSDPLQHYSMGGVYADFTDYPNAVAAYTGALRLDPEYEDAYYGRGNTYYLMARYPQAIADYDQVERLDPQLKGGFPDLFYRRGRAYYSLRSYDRAVRDLTRDLQRRPDHADALYYRGLAFLANAERDQEATSYRLENLKLARRSLETFLQRVPPRHPDADDASLYLQQIRGMQQYLSGKAFQVESAGSGGG